MSLTSVMQRTGTRDLDLGWYSESSATPVWFTRFVLFEGRNSALGHGSSRDSESRQDPAIQHQPGKDEGNNEDDLFGHMYSVKRNWTVSCYKVFLLTVIHIMC